MKTLQDLVESLAAHKDAPALEWKRNGGKQTLTFSELHERVNNYSRGLLELGLEKGDKVALFADNVPEWLGLNLGIVNAGLVDAPRGTDATADEMRYILEHSDAKVVIAQNKGVLDRLGDLKQYRLYTIEHMDNFPHISNLERLGERSKKEVPRVDPNDLAGFIYTSGTTGEPKGAMLTHGNFASNIAAILNRVSITKDDKLLSMLPPWHSFERIVKYTAAAAGAVTFYSSKERVVQDLASEKPTIMASVPKIWERVYDGLMKKVDGQKGLKKKIAKRAIKKSIKYKTKSRFWAPMKRMWHKIADKKVYSQLREKLGGNFRFAVSGGGALPNHVDDFFHAAGVEILEGYGMTETSPLIAVRNPGKGELHTVGTLIEGVEAKLVDPDSGEVVTKGEGVVHVRGPNVMKGYYKNQAETDAVLDNGWMNTGDLGKFHKNGCLQLTGRVKEIIVLKNGENIGPVPIENALKMSPYVADAVVVGQDWKGLGALIVPDFEAVEQYCAKNGIAYDLASDEVQQLYESQIKSHVSTKKGFKPFHLVREFSVLDAEFEVGKDITATLKPMRRKINVTYDEHIQSMYDEMHKK